MRPLPATAAEVAELKRVAERDRPLVVKVETAEVVAQLTGGVEAHVAGFQGIYRDFLRHLGGASESLTQGLAQQISELKKATIGVETASAAAVQATAESAKRTEANLRKFSPGGRIDWSDHRGIVIGLALFFVPIVLIIGTYGATGGFSRVTKDALLAEQAKYTLLSDKNDRLGMEIRYYRSQVKDYVKKYPSRSIDFPRY